VYWSSKEGINVCHQDNRETITVTNRFFFCSVHEEIERLEQAIVDQYMSQPKTQKERLENEHIVSKFLDRITEKSKQLYNLYDDKDG
jgi:hypothetical protein